MAIFPRAMNFVDRTGQRYGRLTFVRHVGGESWLCMCDCGNTKVIRAHSVISGGTKSCGCLFREVGTERGVRLAFMRNVAFDTWRRMVERCYLMSHEEYLEYGSVGIRVCDDWKKLKRFSYWAYGASGAKSGKAGKLVLWRIDKAKGYGPDNCECRVAYESQEG